MGRISGNLHLVTGTAEDISTVSVASTEVRADGSGVITTSPDYVEVSDSGDVTFNCRPGYAVLTLHVYGAPEQSILLLVTQSDQTLAEAVSAAHDSSEHSGSELAQMVADVRTAIADAAASVRWDGDQLTVMGKQSRHLTGAKGDKGDKGEPGSVTNMSWRDMHDLPVNLQYNLGQTTRVQPKGRKLGVTGDSITAAGTGRQNDFVGITYYHLVAMRRNLSIVVNAGVAGQRTDEMRARFNDDFQGKNCDIIFIRGGINDIFQGRNINDAFNDLTWMASRAIELGAVPVIGDLSPVDNAGGDKNGKILGLNNRLGRWCADHGVRFANSYDRLVGWQSPNWGNPDDTWDGTHPTPDGMVKIAEAFLAACADMPDFGPVSAEMDGDPTNLAWQPNPLNRGGSYWGKFVKNGNPKVANATLNTTPGWDGYATRLTLEATAVDDSAAVTADFNIGGIGSGEKYRLACRFNLRSGSQKQQKRVRGWMIVDEYTPSGWVRTLSRHVEGLNLQDESFILDFVPTQGVSKLAVKFMVSAMDAGAVGFLEFGQVRLAVIDAARDELSSVIAHEAPKLGSRFIPVNRIQGAAGFATQGDVVHAPIGDDFGGWLVASELLPQTWREASVSLITVGLGGNGAARMETNVKSGFFGETAALQVNEVLSVPDVAAGVVQKTALAAHVKPGDFITISAHRDGAGDTLATALGVVGILIEEVI